MDFNDKRLEIFIVIEFRTMLRLHLQFLMKGDIHVKETCLRQRGVVYSRRGISRLRQQNLKMMNQLLHTRVIYRLQKYSNSLTRC